MLTGIKVEVFPTVKQQIYIKQLFGAYRFVFNKCLEFKIEQYKEYSVNVGLKEIGSYLHGTLTKSDDTAFLKEHNSKVLVQSAMQVLEAYKKFFVNHAGFPNFKSRKNKQSVRFPADAISKNTFIGNRCNFVKQLKGLKFKCSDKYNQILLENNGKVKSATLSQEPNGNYFVSFLVENEPRQLPEPTSSEVLGIDVGIKSFLVASDGTEITNPKFTRTNQVKLSKLQRQLSKKVKGSNNRNKARLKLAKFQYKINCQKSNFLHNLTTKLITENKVIGIEDLNVKGMMKNHKLARSIQELSLFEFETQLTYKANRYDRKVISIDRFYPSSKLCSNCGWKDFDLNLSDRTYQCLSCGLTIDRDLNASYNIKKEATRLFELTCLATK